YSEGGHDLGVMASGPVGLALALCVVLLAGEIRRPRTASDPRRWPTVFPLVTTATAALSASAVVDAEWLEGLGEVLVWIAVAAWLAVAIGAVRSAVRPGPVPEGIRSTARR